MYALAQFPLAAAQDARARNCRGHGYTVVLGESAIEFLNAHDRQIVASHSQPHQFEWFCSSQIVGAYLRDLPTYV
jgi:hypothetical protein